MLSEEEKVHEQKSVLEPEPSKEVAISERRWSVKKKIVAMLGLASVILVTLNILFYLSLIKQKETSDQVNQSQKNLQALENVFSSLKDAETGQRGYLLTGSEFYLKPYNLALKTIDQQVQELKILSLTDPAFEQQLSTLEPLIRNKLTELQKTVALKKSKDQEAALSLVLTDQGQELMEQIRIKIQQIQTTKSQQLQNWLLAKEQEAHRIQQTFIVCFLLNMLVFYLLYRAIQKEMTEHQQSEASLKKLNEELEDLVKKRTAELEEANINLLRSNKELEQFAYVASHDLQEPLRIINSYTQLLARKYQSHLDAKADKYIGYILEGASRMQQLIEDLLSFSRVSTEIQSLQPIALDTIILQVLSQLKFVINKSNATVTHEPLPTIMGDKTQLVQLFQNLLTNAIKFHGSEPPNVKIKAVRQDNEWLISISDNGIGIAAEYYERIFVIFQRLHSRTDYPGTGIGLAVCKRIVECHGGRIWVESTLGVETTFYIKIPCGE